MPSRRKKLKHKIDIQEMHMNVKQLALEETHRRSSNASAAPKTPKKFLAMGLDDKKELATHNALLKMNWQSKTRGSQSSIK